MCLYAAQLVIVEYAWKAAGIAGGDAFPPPEFVYFVRTSAQLVGQKRPLLRPSRFGLRHPS